MPEDRSLELSGEALRAVIEAATERLLDHVASLPRQPAADTDGAEELARSLRESLPETGRPLEELLGILFERVIPKSFNTAGPGYLAYIPGGGLPHAAVADLISGITNRYVGVFAAAPGVAALESSVIRWFCEMVGYPPEAGGLLTTGGSLSIFSALVTARRKLLPENFLAGTLYVSDQAHYSVAKAAMLAGFPEKSVRLIPTDALFRIRVDALAEAIERDRASGAAPFLLVGNAGTTNTGAVDDLARLAELARREGLWYHVDAAYGGFFALTERGRKVLAGIERADSITLDPHKGLFLPYGTGGLLVRDLEALRMAHAVSADYMPPMQQDPERPDFSQLSPELSRGWRGLRVWLPIAMHGIAPFRRNLEEKLDLTLWATGRLRSIPGIEILAEPQLSIVAFRLRPAGLDEEAANALNRDLLQRINARRRVHLTSTLLRGRFAIRICVLSFRTHQERMEEALEDIRAEAGALYHD
ncbi:MAG: pyridoxal phosphate-dependent decarboxylase family protein [Acidobacteriota bacterium]